MRKLSNHFMNELLKGSLCQLLTYVKDDNTLDLEIREDYINIYYRGGNILKVDNYKNSSFSYKFDEGYLKGCGFISYNSLIGLIDNKEWNNYFPLAKQVMDLFITKNPQEEREFQQLVVRENNYSSIANGTDYFIIDIEYNNHKNARFDLVSVEWPSKASERKLQAKFKPKLTVIEMKYGDGALRGEAGLLKHCRDWNKFWLNQPDVKSFKDEMVIALRQKRELGLIPDIAKNKNSNQITEFSDEINYIFLITNHDPASTILRTELNKLHDYNIRLTATTFLGYGLYNENIFNLNDFTRRFVKQL